MVINMVSQHSNLNYVPPNPYITTVSVSFSIFVSINFSGKTSAALGGTRPKPHARKLAQGRAQGNLMLEHRYLNLEQHPFHFPVYRG